jgi:hypothetical protein
MAFVETDVIFPMATYYPQVHPQAVENIEAYRWPFDWTSSHVSKRQSNRLALIPLGGTAKIKEADA